MNLSQVGVLRGLDGSSVLTGNSCDHIIIVEEVGQKSSYQVLQSQQNYEPKPCETTKPSNSDKDIMATASFNEKVIIKDEKTATEIKEDLNSDSVDSARRSNVKIISMADVKHNTNKWIVQ